MNRRNDLFVDIKYFQEKKSGFTVCGDLVLFEKKDEVTNFILLDGLGSGINANFSSHLYGYRILKLFDLGLSLRETAASIINTLHEVRAKDIPFSAFTIVRILKNLSVSAICYETPPPVIIENNYSYAAKGSLVTINNENFYEYSCRLNENSSIVVMTDGITQGLMKNVIKNGLDVKPVIDIFNDELKKLTANEVIEKIYREIKNKNNNKFPDDATFAVLSGRKGRILNLLTGPCRNKTDDEAFINKFVNCAGIKTVCGSTTADILARVTGNKIEKTYYSDTIVKPPKYKISGINLVTEGILVLNQLYNIIDKDPETLDPDSCVTELALMINACDIINFKIGLAENEVNNSISFTQLKILPRREITALLCEKLVKMGKMVNAEYY